MEDFKLIFLQLAILSHILSDFVFQTNKIVNEKNSDIYEVSKKAHYKHAGTVLITNFILLILPCSPDVALLYSLMITVLHYLLDKIKVRFFTNNKLPKLIVFLVDQIIHLLIIMFLWRRFEVHLGIYKNWFSNIIYNNFSDLLLRINSDLVINCISIMIIYIFICWGGAVIVDLTLDILGINSKNASKNVENNKKSIIETDTSIKLFPFRLPLKTTTSFTVNTEQGTIKNDENTVRENGYLISKYIGVFERMIIITLVMKNQYGAIGFVFAAKSLARANDLLRKDNEYSGYYLIGTLLSTAMAIFGGILLTFLLGY